MTVSAGQAARLQTRLRAWSASRAARFGPAPPLSSTPSLAELMAIQDTEFNWELLRADPQFARLSNTEAENAIALAVADGRNRAAAWRDASGPGAIALALGVPVVVAGGGNRFGAVFQLAEYRSRPPGITLYAAAMDLLRDVILRERLTPLLGLDDPAPVYLAHELYHHLDSAAPVSIARAVQVTTIAVGPLRVRSGLVSLQEIGAASFAAALTGIRRHPRLLDALARRALRQATQGWVASPTDSRGGMSHPSR